MRASARGVAPHRPGAPPSYIRWAAGWARGRCRRGMHSAGIRDEARAFRSFLTARRVPRRAHPVAHLDSPRDLSGTRIALPLAVTGIGVIASRERGNRRSRRLRARARFLRHTRANLAPVKLEAGQDSLGSAEADLHHRLSWRPNRGRIDSARRAPVAKPRGGASVRCPRSHPLPLRAKYVWRALRCCFVPLLVTYQYCPWHRSGVGAEPAMRPVDRQGHTRRRCPATPTCDSREGGE